MVFTSRSALGPFLRGQVSVIGHLSKLLSQNESSSNCWRHHRTDLGSKETFDTGSRALWLCTFADCIKLMYEDHSVSQTGPSSDDLTVALSSWDADFLKVQSYSLAVCMGALARQR